MILNLDILFYRAFLSVFLILSISSCKKINKAASDQSLTGLDAALFLKPTLHDYKYMGLERKTSHMQEPLPKAQYEKKLVDIPLPMSCKKIVGYEDVIDTTSVALTRVINLSRKELYTFYYCMLEQMGWFLKTSLTSPHEQLMIWEKPNKLCTISLRSSTQQSYFNRSKTKRTLLVIHAQYQS